MLESFRLFVQTASFLLFIVLALFMIIAYSRLFHLNKKINRLKKRYDRLLRGQGDFNLEELIGLHGQQIQENKDQMKDIIQSQKEMYSKVQFSFQKLGFVQYDAFPDTMNELSYTLVLLDSFNNGVMITSIYGREQSTSFTKYIRDGKTNIKLSPEERAALKMAVNGELPSVEKSEFINS